MYLYYEHTIVFFYKNTLKQFFGLISKKAKKNEKNQELLSFVELHFISSSRTRGFFWRFKK